MTASLMISGSYFPPQVGGISRYVAEICASLGPRRVSVLTGVRSAARHLGHDGLSVHRRPLAFKTHDSLHWLALAFALGEVVLRERPSVLQFATCEDAHIAWLAHRMLHLPYVVYAYGNEILGAIDSAWPRPRQVLLAARRVIAVSRYTASLVEQTGVAREHIEVVHPGCDTRRFAPRVLSEEQRRALIGVHWDKRVVLSTGNLVERKGHDIAMLALSKIASKFPDVCYVIVGDGPYRGTLEHRAVELGIRDRVIFAGRVSEDELVEYYNLCEVFLMPSRLRADRQDVEGFGMVYLEAAGCGKPSIGGLSGGVSEAIHHQRTGLMVNPDDADEVASALGTLLTHADWARQLGRAARLAAVADHDWKKIGSRVAGIITDVAGGR